MHLEHFIPHDEGEQGAATQQRAADSWLPEQWAAQSHEGAGVAAMAADASE